MVMRDSAITSVCRAKIFSGAAIIFVDAADILVGPQILVRCASVSLAGSPAMAQGAMRTLLHSRLQTIWRAQPPAWGNERRFRRSCYRLLRRFNCRRGSQLLLGEFLEFREVLLELLLG